MPEAKKPGLAASFNSPASEAVLSLHQLLVKVISAKELPRSSTAQRRNVSVEVTLVGSGGASIEGGMHSRTGPPNHFSTVKDTAPVWNAEFVSEVSEELLSGANLRFDVWDDATSPPVHMGAALLEEAALRELRNRDEERSLPIRPEHASSAPGGGGGSLRLRVALVDVRDALARLPEAEAKATQAQHRVDAAEREQNGARVGMRLLASALQEEESQVAVLRHGTPGTQSAVSSQERVDARLAKAKEDAEVVVAAVRDEKKQAMGALVGMHQQTLEAFKQDLSTQAAISPLYLPHISRISPHACPLYLACISPIPRARWRHAGGASRAAARRCHGRAARRAGRREGGAGARAGRGDGRGLRVG